MASRNSDLLDRAFRKSVAASIRDALAGGAEMRVYCTVRDPFEQARLWRSTRSKEEIDRKIEDLDERRLHFIAGCIREVGPVTAGAVTRHVTNAVPGESWHQFFGAVDAFWLLDGKAVWSTRKRIRRPDGVRINGYKIWAQCVRDNGLVSGASWADWPHVQSRRGSPVRHYGWAKVDSALHRMYGAYRQHPMSSMELDARFDEGERGRLARQIFSAVELARFDL